MKKELQREAIRLLQDMLERYWQHDYQYALSNMADDVIWIGANLEEHMQGLDQVTEDFIRQDKEIVSCHLSNQDFRIIHHSKTSISIAGKYLVTTDPETELVLQVWQRCFAVFIYDKGRFIMKGLHVSNPLGELHVSNEEMFPRQLGEQSYRFLMDNVKELQTKKVMVTTKDRVVHFFFESEIICVESSDHDIVITLLNEELVVRGSLSKFYEEHKDSLVRTQRSLLVNPRYIRHITENVIAMDNGKELWIPPKLRAEAVRILQDYLSRQQPTKDF